MHFAARLLDDSIASGTTVLVIENENCNRSLDVFSSRRLRVRFEKDGAKGFVVDEMLYELSSLVVMIQKKVAEDPCV